MPSPARSPLPAPALPPRPARRLAVPPLPPGPRRAPAVRVVVERVPAPGEMSCGKRGRATVIEAEAFRRWFPGALARWLRGTFASPEQAAPLFGRDVKTVTNWWRGDHVPSGDAAALVFLDFPAAQAWFLAEWAREGR
jgi:hypothetical protein